MHVALMEPTDRRLTDEVAALCASNGASLHLIGPFGIEIEDFEGENAGSALDLWVHPDWFEFRRAIARERCYYFSVDGTKEVDEARFRPTSVLMFAGPEGMPDRIKEKYPHRLYKLPAGGIAGVRAVLAAALQKVGAPADRSARGGEGAEAPAPEQKGRPRRRSAKRKG